MPARLLFRLLVLSLVLLVCASGLACYHPHYWHHW